MDDRSLLLNIRALSFYLRDLLSEGDFKTAEEITNLIYQFTHEMEVDRQDKLMRGES